MPTPVESIKDMEEEWHRIHLELSIKLSEAQKERNEAINKAEYFKEQYNMAADECSRLTKDLSFHKEKREPLPVERIIEAIGAIKYYKLARGTSLPDNIDLDKLEAEANAIIARYSQAEAKGEK